MVPSELPAMGGPASLNLDGFMPPAEWLVMHSCAQSTSTARKASQVKTQFIPNKVGQALHPLFDAKYTRGETSGNQQEGHPERIVKNEGAE